MTIADPLDAARTYSRRGFRVIPLHRINGNGGCTCHTPGCKSPGKHPLWNDWQRRGVIGDADVHGIWGEGQNHPGANIGILTGNGLLGVDLDLYHNSGCRADLEAAIGEDLPATYTVTTGRGGVHLYYTIPVDEGLTNGADIVRGVDIRADGGFLVAPPSVSGFGP